MAHLINLWFKNYRDLEVSVSVHADGKLEITKDEIQTKVELRLREANIRPRKSIPASEIFDAPSLQVNLAVVGLACNIQIELQRFATWEAPDGSPGRNWVSTWEDATVGTHGNSRSSVMSHLDNLLDQFLNDYLRANQGRNEP